MKKFSIFLLVYLFACSAASAEIVGMWLFDEGDDKVALDSSGREHEMQLLGADVVAGKFGQALALKDDGFMELEHHEDFNFPEAYTIMIWANIEEITPDIYVGMPRKENEYVLAAHKGGEIEMTMWINVGGWQGPIPALGSGIATSYGEWHHYASTYDGETCRVYVNGEESGSQQVGGELSVGQAPIRVSGTISGARFMVGTIDEFIMANEVFTQEQIKDFMTKGAHLALAVEPDSKLAITWGAIKQ